MSSIIESIFEFVSAILECINMAVVHNSVGTVKCVNTLFHLALLVAIICIIVMVARAVYLIIKFRSASKDEHIHIKYPSNNLSCQIKTSSPVNIVEEEISSTPEINSSQFSYELVSTTFLDKLPVTATTTTTTTTTTTIEPTEHESMPHSSPVPPIVEEFSQLENTSFPQIEVSYPVSMPVPQQTISSTVISQLIIDQPHPQELPIASQPVIDQPPPQELPNIVPPKQATARRVGKRELECLQYEAMSVSKRHTKHDTYQETKKPKRMTRVSKKRTKKVPSPELEPPQKHVVGQSTIPSSLE
jgi:hypothetical protein